MQREILERYSIRDVQEGMVLGKMVLTDAGKLALDAGTVLTASLIERLRDWGVDSVEIRTVVSDYYELEKKGSEFPVSVAQQQFQKGYDDTVDEVRKAFSGMRFFKEVPLQEMCHLAESNVETLVDSVGVINHLHMVKRQDDYTFHHSVNVSIISGVLGRWLGYRGAQLQEIVLSGLLHDIGKTQIPLEILNKPGPLTSAEMEVMKQHPARGYQMLTGFGDGIPQGVLHGVLQHHERMDGTGYPLRVGGDKIHFYAQIVAIADIYDAMTSDRVYREKVTPFAVVDMIIKEMFHKLDPQISMTFLNNVRDYFIGNIVELSTGDEAEVVYLGQTTAARPIVKISDDMFIDLEKQKDIGIVRIIQS